MARVVADRYEIGVRIGAGGMAEVFEAHDRRLGRRVAIKFLRTDLADRSAWERFNREARAAAGLSHPNIVKVFDVGDDPSQPYLVLELVEGRSLADLLAERGRLEPEEAVAIAGQVLSALGAAHAQNLVHRDVKPANILLTADGTAKLTDFGIAQAIDDATSGLTATGQILGTPKYLSPEQIGGDRATAQSDLYAVGVVLYEMLAGEPPFHGETPIATALAHQRAPVPSLDALRPGLGAPLVAVVERALRKDPARRFESAEAMRAALLARPNDPTLPSPVEPTLAMLDDPTLPSPVDPTAPLPAPRHEPRPRTPRRWRAGLVAAGIAAALVVTGVFVATAGNDDKPSTAVPPTTKAAATRTTVARTTAPRTTASVTAVPDTTPRTLDGLVALVAADPNAYGDHGKDLLNKLQQVQHDIATKPGDKGTRDHAAQTVEQIGKWMDDGKLDRTIGTLAQRILQPYADG